MSELPAKAETTEEKQKPAHLFKPGQSGNPKGRPKGSRHKLGEDFIRAMQEDFEKNGVAAITIVRETRPHEYLKVVASILPKELNVTTNTVTDLSDDDVTTLIDAVRSAFGAEALKGARGGASAPDQAEPAQDLRPVH